MDLAMAVMEALQGAWTKCYTSLTTIRTNSCREVLRKLLVLVDSWESLSLRQSERTPGDYLCLGFGASCST